MRGSDELRQRTRWLRWGAVFAVATLAFTSCSGAPSSTSVQASSTAGGNGGAVGASSGAAPVSLSMWTFLDPAGTDPRGKALAEIVSTFNSSHPQVRVTVTSINYAKIDAQVIQATAAGVGPDIVNIYTDQLPEHVAAGTIQSMDQYARPWLAQEGNNYLFPIQSTTYAGKIMALPWEMRVWLLWYRTDLYKQYGLSVPTTLTQLVSEAAQLRQDTGGKTTGFAIGMSQGGLGADFMEKFQPLLWAYGGDLLTSSGKAAFQGPAGVSAMTWLKSLVTDGAMGTDMLNVTADDVLSGIQAGTIGMADEGSFRVAAARTSLGTNLGTAPMPGLTAAAPLPTLSAGQTLAIGKDSKYPAQAWEFIQYYLSDASQLLMANAGELPVLNSVYSASVLATGPQANELKVWRQYLSKYGRVARQPANYAQLAQIVVQAAQNIMYHDAPIPATLATAASQYDALGGGQ